MRIVFFGATELGYECCRRLLDLGEEVVGIFSIPREFRISYATGVVKNVTYRGFEDLAERHGIPLLYVESTKDIVARADRIRELRPDFGVVIGWYYMVPKSIRDLFPKGVAGIHASLLPRYRGGAPLVWAMINGEATSGVSLFYFDDGVDTGDVVAQKEFSIEEDDTIRTVYDKAMRASLEIVEEYIPRIRLGTAPRVAQDHSQATQFPQRKPEDGLIDWTRSPQEIRNFIRAQTRPYPGAFTYIGDKRVTIWDADVEYAPPPGER